MTYTNGLQNWGGRTRTFNFLINSPEAAKGRKWEFTEFSPQNHRKTGSSSAISSAI
jgi:hypothetical protein